MTTINRAQRGETYAGYTDLTVMVCSECGVLYAIPERMRATAERRGGFTLMWHCPNGHELGYGENQAEKLERQLDTERRRSARLVAERDQAEAHARAQKGRATRFKNDRDRERRRVAAGVCPCCNRTFQNLARHMATKHPDHAVPEDSESAA